MGCMATKESDCFQLCTHIEEVTTARKTIEECYMEIQLPYPIRESINPILQLAQTPSKKPSRFTVPLRLKDLPIFEIPNDALINSAIEVFSDFSLDLSKLTNFLELVSKNYYFSNPFHNFIHGFSVFHLIYVISERNTKLSEFITYRDYLHLLIAAIGHDICHPGVNNSYLIAVKHEVALKYNNASPLENHHAAVTLELIKNSELFTEKEFNSMRKPILDMILSTDMAKHKGVLEEFIKVTQGYDIESIHHKQSFMNFLLHCCDLGNQALDFGLASMWSLKVIHEFNYQVVCEEGAGITVSEFMRIGNSIEKIKGSQVAFIDLLILPMWSTLAMNVRNVEDFVETVKENRKKWQMIKGFINN